jgi:hypothetical protein
MGWTTEELGLDLWQGKEIFLLFTASHIASFPLGNRVSFPVGMEAGNVTTRLHLVPWLRLHGECMNTMKEYLRARICLHVVMLNLAALSLYKFINVYCKALVTQCATLENWK